MSQKPAYGFSSNLLMDDQIEDIQEKIGYQFTNIYLLEQAFIRSSYAEENPGYENNERLEFVGDSILSAIIVKKMTNHYTYKDIAVLDYLDEGEKVIFNYKKFLFFTHTEGEMTEIKKSIVRAETLAKAIEKLKLEQYLFMSNGDSKKKVQNV